MIVTSLLLLIFHIRSISADYNCLCNHKDGLAVFSTMSELGPKVGYMYEYECKQLLQITFVSDGWYTVAFEHKVGYILNGSQVELTVCNGDPPTSDLASKAGATICLTSSFAATSTPSPAATTTATKATAAMATQQMAMNTSAVPQGHIELCPENIKTDINRFGGFIDQYGDFCYELVSRPTQWDNAEHHCYLISQGHLVDIQNKPTQDFLVSFLSVHHYVENVWIGLSDKSNKGVFTWTTGQPLTYTNFALSNVSQHNHTLSDCVVMNRSGSWVERQCGVAIGISFGYGESHPYICQYNITSKPPDIFPMDVILG